MEVNARTTAKFRNALRDATLSINDIADQMGWHRNSLNIALNQRAPSPELLDDFVDWLEQHIGRLAVYAETLRDRRE